MEEKVIQNDYNGASAGEPLVTDPIAQLYKRLSPSVYAYLLSRTGSPEEAEDMLGEVFVIACRKQDRVLDARAPDAWVIGVARNLARNRGRRSRREVALQWDPKADGAGPEQQLQTAWTRATTLQTIAKLSRRRAEALRLRYLAELDYPQIARMLGTTVGAAKMTVSRARNDLRRLLTESENKEE